MRPPGVSSPRRILFYQDSLAQAGSERALYEMARGLDRQEFSIDILTSARTVPDYYATRLRAEGFSVLPFAPWPTEPGSLVPESWKSLRHRWFRRRAGEQFRSHLKQYDGLAVFLAENYRAVQEWLRPSDRVALFHMSHGTQYEASPLSELRPEGLCRLVLMDEGQRPDIEGTAWESTPVEMLPLLIEPPDDEVSYRAPPGPPWRVGYFSRLSPQKPLEPFLFALQILRQTLDVRLHVYGSGDRAGYDHMLGYLGLRQAVVFEGHRERLETVLDDGIAIGWLPSVGDFVGYAAIELALRGLPIQFWRMGSVKPPAGTIVAPAATVDGLARDTERLLRAGQRGLRERGRALREHLGSGHLLENIRPQLHSVFRRLFAA
jgi:glycosyltransferase involved in cell wall biosynthesis